jgi:hypothetical protein
MHGHMNGKFHYIVYKHPFVVPVLSVINSGHIIPAYFGIPLYMLDNPTRNRFSYTIYTHTHIRTRAHTHTHTHTHVQIILE